MNSKWLIILLAGAALNAQDISGDWQGTLKAGKDLRTILHIAKSDAGGWSVTMYSIDQSPDRGAGMPASSVTVEGSSFKFTVEPIRGSYEGKVSADGTSITGIWTQRQARPLDFQRATKDTAWLDPSPHTAQFVSVDKNVELEVLDWGGSGRPLILLAGQGNSAHIFDEFAPKLRAACHVYGITRRGYGASSRPAPTSANYAADRLGDDVLAVIEALKLNRPVLTGHSLAGEELSSVGSRRPDKVAGLIYLDAGYSYAYHDPSGPAPTPRPTSAKAQTPIPTVQQAIQAGMQKYTDIRPPMLAIYALPHDRGITDPAAREAADASDLEVGGAQARAFAKGLPSARVVWIAHANHFVFRSNEVEVLREMNAFIGELR